jgi:hypothetical protein
VGLSIVDLGDRGARGFLSLDRERRSARDRSRDDEEGSDRGADPRDRLDGADAEPADDAHPFAADRERFAERRGQATSGHDF